MNTYYLLVIVATLVGFCGLAYLLLAPIWRFLDREREVSEQWTKDALARRRREHQRREQQREGEASSRSDAAGDGRSPEAPRSAPGGDGAPGA